jgi:hypothetical protein
VAEPGLRHTAGECVDLEGSRGVQIPPLRHPNRMPVFVCRDSATRIAALASAQWMNQEQEPGWTREQDMIEHVTAATGRLDGHPEDLFAPRPAQPVAGAVTADSLSFGPGWFSSFTGKHRQGPGGHV